MNPIKHDANNVYKQVKFYNEFQTV